MDTQHTPTAEELLANPEWVALWGECSPSLLRMRAEDQAERAAKATALQKGPTVNDRELLEAAARAAGVDVIGYAIRLLALPNHDGSLIVRHAAGGDVEWNPLASDGDALRLAVKLNITVFIYDDETSTALNGVVAKNWGSKEANTRRAIVMAAASLSQEKPHG